MSHNPTDILDIILQRLRTLATTETVVGQPVTIGELTLLPVIKMSVGFIAGGAEGKGEAEKTGGGSGTAGGGGGGANITPLGFICWDGKDIRFIGVGKSKIETLIEAVPEALKKVGINLSKFSGKDKDKGDEDKGHSADKPDSGE